MERAELEYEAKIAAVRQAVAEGDASGVAEGDPIARVRQAIRDYKKQR
jgi:hypothetical protein